MTHFFLGFGLGAGSAGVAWLATHSLAWTCTVGAVVFAVVWIGQHLADRHP
jgi:hypothetical protein